MLNLKRVQILNSTTELDIILWTCLHLYYNLQRPHVGGQSLFNTNL